MNGNAIVTENLCRDFGALRAVDDLSIRVPAGSVYGFLGPNGAGKTTTIRLLLGLLEASGGHAAVLGFDTRRQADEIRKRCGALLEYHGLYERISALENLEFYGRIWHIPAAERQARIREILTHMGLWDRRSELAGSWSRGMKQKLAVARALLHRPDLIFLDEPTAGLDPVAAKALRDDLAALAKKEGTTIFLTTHNLAEAEKLCQRVGVIRQGKLLATGTIEELRLGNGAPHVKMIGSGFDLALLERVKSSPLVASASLEDHGMSIELKHETEIAPLVSLVVSAGGQVEEVVKGKASLEEVFMTLMEEDKEAEK